ncbi:MAG TPA: hypothetical protein VK641_08615, partial [Terriglobales bacterium]|nr:hypothetical protein [Terriglobales bacterium]
DGRDGGARLGWAGPDCPGGSRRARRRRGLAAFHAEVCILTQNPAALATQHESLSGECEF